uniref:Uncharacterized protein n=1 Tax=Desulfovibrio sp. U5L TaxID=596152 RepID=I2Q692_9BACT
MPDDRLPLSGYDRPMWETALVSTFIFLLFGALLRFYIQKTVRMRHDALAPGRFDFDAFKSREIAGRGVHDSTRVGKKR